jgi:hypothetical protein
MNAFHGILILQRYIMSAFRVESENEMEAEKHRRMQGGRLVRMG